MKPSQRTQNNTSSVYTNHKTLSPVYRNKKDIPTALKKSEIATSLRWPGVIVLNTTNTITEALLNRGSRTFDRRTTFHSQDFPVLSSRCITIAFYATLPISLQVLVPSTSSQISILWTRASTSCGPRYSAWPTISAAGMSYMACCRMMTPLLLPSPFLATVMFESTSSVALPSGFWVHLKAVEARATSLLLASSALRTLLAPWYWL